MASGIGCGGTAGRAERAAPLRAPRRAGLVLLAASFLASAGAAPHGGKAANAPPAAAVQIEAFRFAPATLEVPAGTTVRWVNHDDELHTVAFLDGQAASPALDTDDSFSRRFDAPGTYAYRCAIHPHMAGTIVVR